MTAEPVTRAAAPRSDAARPAFASFLQRARRDVEEGPPVLSADPHDPRTFLLPPLAMPRDEAAPRAAPSPIVAQLDPTLHVAASLRSVELRVSPDLGVHLSRTHEGLVVVVEAAPLRAGPAEAELPRIVRALRARGLSVSHAGVRTASGRSGAGARAR